MNYSAFLNDLNVKIQNKAGSIPVSARTFINQVLRNTVSATDFVSLIRHTKSYQAVYDDIVRFPLPSDMKNEAIIDIQKYSNYSRASYTKYRKVSPNVFRTMQEQDTVAFDYSDGMSWLLGNFNTNNQSTVINTLDTLTSNGTWSAADNGENIIVNTLNYIAGSGSISCDMASAGTVLSIVNTTMTALDLTNTDRLFVWEYLPVATNLTTATLVYGSSVSAYYTTTATTPFNVTSFDTGWNLIAFDTGTATGSPDITAIDYVKLSLTYSATPAILTGFLFDSLLASQGDPIEISYYSKFPWKSSAGTWMLDSTSNEDVLNATETEYNVWLAECAYEASKAIPLSDSQIQLLRADRDKAMMDYKTMYPSRKIKERNYMFRPSTNVSKRSTRGVNFDDISNAV